MIVLCVLCWGVDIVIINGGKIEVIFNLYDRKILVINVFWGFLFYLSK